MFLHKNYTFEIYNLLAIKKCWYIEYIDLVI